MFDVVAAVVVFILVLRYTVFKKSIREDLKALIAKIKAKVK
jgi:hypothetical protein